MTVDYLHLVAVALSVAASILSFHRPGPGMLTSLTMTAAMISGTPGVAFLSGTAWAALLLIAALASAIWTRALRGHHETRWVICSNVGAIAMAAVILQGDHDPATNSSHGHADLLISALLIAYLLGGVVAVSTGRGGRLARFEAAAMLLSIAAMMLIPIVT